MSPTALFRPPSGSSGPLAALANRPHDRRTRTATVAHPARPGADLDELARRVLRSAAEARLRGAPLGIERHRQILHQLGQPLDGLTDVEPPRLLQRLASTHVALLLLSKNRLAVRRAEARERLLLGDRATRSRRDWQRQTQLVSGALAFLPDRAAEYRDRFVLSDHLRLLMLPASAAAAATTAPVGAAPRSS